MSDEATKCDMCQRERTADHALDYSPMQVLTGSVAGWYSDGLDQICGPCMVRLVNNQ